MRRGIGGIVIVLTLGAGGCAADPEAAGPVDQSTTAAAATAGPTYGAPTTATPGACSWSLAQADVATEAPQQAPTMDAPTGDMPPQHGLNRAWRQRSDPTAEQLDELRSLVPRVKPILVSACRAGDFSPDRLSRDLASAVDPAETWATQRTSANGEATTAIDGYVYTAGACLIFAVQPDAIVVGLTTPIADGGCWEPPAH